MTKSKNKNQFDEIDIDGWIGSKIPKNGTCCLCGKPYTLYGNNPYPFCDKDDDKSRCCNDCNREKVIPARLSALKMNC